MEVDQDAPTVTMATRSSTNGPALASTTADRPEAHFYDYFLESCEKVFEGEMDQATFEEHMRWFFRTKVSGLSKSLWGRCPIDGPES